MSTQTLHWFKRMILIFCAGALGFAGALGISLPKSIWSLAIWSHSGPKYLYLVLKFSYLHVYLVPTCLLIFSISSHLHVYLVYTFIQYQGVSCILSLLYPCNHWKSFKFASTDYVIQKSHLVLMSSILVRSSIGTLS